jgi:hypothetical protein
MYQASVENRGNSAYRIVFWLRDQFLMGLNRLPKGPLRRITG